MGRHRKRGEPIAMGAFLALAALTAGAPPVQGQARTLYVNATDPTCGGAAPCHATIQAAVDAALPGERVVVQAGRYVEQVVVQGKNAGAGASEGDRIVVEADAAAAPGSVVVEGPGGKCDAGVAVRVRQSRFVTLRGMTVTGGGIVLMGGAAQNEHVHLERLRVVGVSGACDAAVAIGRGNAGTVVANSLVHANARNGVALEDTAGGPHLVVGNTIHGNGWNGVSVTRGHELFLVNNAITGNGTAAGSGGGRAGVRREPGGPAQPALVHLLHNLLCANRAAQIDGPLLDATDAGNLTPTGTEGAGVLPSPTCGSMAAVYAAPPGPDGAPGTADDDFTPAPGSPLLDAGLDPRTLALGLEAVLEADFHGADARPRSATGATPARFDIGALEAAAPNQPPIASAGADRTVVELTDFTLDGTGSHDPDGDVLAFAWTQIAGPPAAMTGEATATPGVTAPAVTTATALVFELRVSDGRETAADGVTVTVVPANRAPVLDPVGPLTIWVGGVLAFTLTGSDPDGDALTYSAAPLPAGSTLDPATGAFAFTPDAAQIGSLSVTFTVADGRGGTASETVTIRVVPGLQITITSPLDGAALVAGPVLVRGVADAAATAVAVEGVIAALDGGVFAAQVHVSEGATTLTAVATGPESAMGAHTIAIAAGSGPAAALVATPTSGIAPVTIRFTLEGLAPTSVTLDLDGDGTADFTGPTLEGHEFLYTAPGVYFPTATVDDGQGAPRTLTTVLLVESPAAVTARFQGLWDGFKGRLVAGDVAAALMYLSPAIEAQFAAIFAQLGAALPGIAASLESLVVVDQVEDLAETAVLRQEGEEWFIYFVYFRRDALGRWRIEEM
jgi:hypothetical protein